nr:cytochrome P450 78A5-like [Ipomoea batatas]
MSPQDFSLLFLPNSGLSVLTFPVLACFFSLLAVVAFWLRPGGLAWALSNVHLRNRAAIPGPHGLPLLGMVLAFTGPLTHRVLQRLAKALKAESLMAFSVGFTRFIISSNPDTAKEILGSPAFADRPVKESAYELLFHKAMGFAPYGDYWRNLRRISSTHLFCPKRIASFGAYRNEIGLKMVDEIKSLMEKEGEVKIKKILHFASLNNVMKTVFGRCYDFTTQKGSELEELVSEGYELLGTFNWTDHFPVLGWFDFQGVRRRCRDLVGKVNVFVGDIIDDHRVKRSQNQNVAKPDDFSGDFVDVLLDMENENKLSASEMTAVLWEMLFRGTDTVAILLEWILARMVVHPEIQARAQAEIDNVVGRDRAVSDADLPNLPYLSAIVKETLRVHPPGPLLSWARLAVGDTHVGEHFIPAGTTAMVNMYAITHDERIWPEPEKFQPERFMEEDVPIMGSDLRLAPFGSGRRVCPGKTMGYATVQLWLAQLLHNFTWEASGEKGLDLSEVLKLSMEMKKPLACKAVARVF